MKKYIRGFGKNYFNLNAIAVYSNAIYMHSKTTSYIYKSVFKYLFEENEDSPPDDLLKEPIPFLEQNKKPCFCHKYLTLLTKIIVSINIFIPRCPYYTTYFAFRRTGVHPPAI